MSGRGRASSKGRGKGQEARGPGKGRAKGKAKPRSFPSDKPGYRWVEKYLEAGEFRKKSLFATLSFEDQGNLSAFPGHARVTQLRTCSEMLGILECILVEPSTKKLVPQGLFVTTGVIICLHGMPPSEDVMEEWGSAVTTAGWADLSCTVVIPNVQMSAALQLQDFEAIVDAALEIANFNRCLIVGKAWGAQRAVEIAALGTLGGKVEGIILVAPSSPAPEMCCEVAVPALVLWARDDEVSAIEDAEVWKEALDDRPAPTSFLTCDSGGHRLDRMLEDGLTAQAIRNFTAASLLVGELQEVTGDQAGIQRQTSKEMVSERERRLSSEMPRFLQDSEEEDDDDDGSKDDSDEEAREKDRAANLMKAEKRGSKTLDIMNWMQAGMTTAAE